MKAHEIFLHLPEPFVATIFQNLYENDKPAYRACMHILSTRRNLRPVLLERKSRDERAVWMRQELTRKNNDDTAMEILQSWLLGSHEKLICDFLDTLKITHNGHGLVDSLPADPGEEKLQAAVDLLLKNHPQEAVAVYLHLFIQMDIAEWPALEKILQNDSRLCLTPQILAA
jgi:hypothetical protein